MSSSARRNLARGFSCKTDHFDWRQWSDTLGNYSDANIYQTWQYGVVRGGLQSLSHCALEYGGSIAAIAQVWVKKLPVLPAGIAYVRWGPLWHKQGVAPDIEVFRQAIRGLRNEYCCKRGLLLRIRPILFVEEHTSFLSIFKEEGFSCNTDLKTDRTLVIDLTKPLEELRKGLDQKWRNQLNRAQKNGLTVREGANDALFETFVKLYDELLSRKKFIDNVNVREFRHLQQELPEHAKMRVFICYEQNTPCAGVICTAMGKRAVFLFGATNDAGLKNKGSYLTQWSVVEWLKSVGVEQYDLHGISPEANPGTYTYKAGLCGKNGKDVRFLGVFESGGNPLSHVVIRGGEAAGRIARKAQEVILSSRKERRSKE
jgi:hypothetical protein